jgi:triacylglycerol lipase
MRAGPPIVAVLLFEILLGAACGAPPAMTEPADRQPAPPGMMPADPPPVPVERGPYPIVLAHGFSGFRNIGPIDYFYGVKAALEKDGHRVFISIVEPFASSVTRGEQLANYIETVVLPQSGARRVNIIGHSQGGLDARYVAMRLGGKVATVFTVATPHHGSAVADVLWGDKPGPLKDLLAALLDIFGGSETNAKAALKNLTTNGAEGFNGTVFDHPNVLYFSIGGRSDRSLGSGSCDTLTQPAFIAKWDRYVDPIGIELALGAAIIDDDLGIANDGLVSVESSRWGIFLGCVPSDHLGEVCQLFGAARGGGNPFTCTELYRDIARFLVERGF